MYKLLNRVYKILKYSRKTFYNESYIRIHITGSKIADIYIKRVPLLFSGFRTNKSRFFRVVVVRSFSYGKYAILACFFFVFFFFFIFFSPGEDNYMKVCIYMSEDYGCRCPLLISSPLYRYFDQMLAWSLLISITNDDDTFPLSRFVLKM